MREWPLSIFCLSTSILLKNISTEMCFKNLKRHDLQFKCTAAIGYWPEFVLDVSFRSLTLKRHKHVQKDNILVLNILHITVVLPSSINLDDNDVDLENKTILIALVQFYQSPYDLKPGILDNFCCRETHSDANSDSVG